MLNPRNFIAATCFTLAIASTAVSAPQAELEIKGRDGAVIATIGGDGARCDVPRAVEIEGEPSVTGRIPAARGERTEAIAATVASPHAWPMYQMDARHTGYLPASFDTTLFKLRWQKDLGIGRGLNPVTGGDGKVFVSLLNYFQSGPSFFALRTTDGETLWSKEFANVHSVNPPSYAYGRVYLQTGNHSSDTWLRAFDPETGDQFFQAPHAAQWERYYAPTAYDGKIYVNGGYYGGMYAFDATSGAQQWFAGLPQYDEWTPAVTGDVAYAYVGGYFYALDRATGDQLYFIPDPGFDWNGYDMNLAPVVGGYDNVIVINSGRVLSFDTVTPRIRWAVGESYAGQPTLAHEKIFAIKGNRIYVLDEQTGAELWWWQPESGTPMGSLIVTDSHLFASTASATYAVDLSTGLTTWSYPVGGKIAIADSTLFIAGGSGVLTAISVPHLVPTSLVIDDGGNGMLEPGEVALVRPSWNAGALAVADVDGEATSTIGFTMLDASARYGDVMAGETVNCIESGDCYGVEVGAVRPQTHWDATMHETLSSGDRHAWKVHVGASFTDVSTGSPYYRFIETLLHNGVTSGCSSTTFCPTSELPREQMAVQVLLAKEGFDYRPTPCGGAAMFSDVPIPSPYCRWVEELARRGVVAGCGNGKYCGSATVTRSQMAVFLLRTLDNTLDPPSCTNPMFGDVPVSSPFCRWIEELARRNIVKGCGGGNYCPEASMLREQAAVTLTGTFGLDLE